MELIPQASLLDYLIAHGNGASLGESPYTLYNKIN